MEKTAIANLFDSISLNYDRANSLLSLGLDHYWRFKMVRCLKAGTHNILDACCGTGSSSYSFYKASGRNAHVFGIDFSPKMLEKAKKRYAHFAPHLKFGFSDASNLDFEDNFFDAVTIAYGIRNITERGKALAEFYRVTKAGGKLICLEFGYPQNGLVGWAYGLYLNLVLINLGGLLSKNRAAYAYLVKSIREFPPSFQFLEVIKAAGYQKVEVLPLSMGICNLYLAYKG